MKRILLFYIIGLCCMGPLAAQQLPLFSEYTQNGFIINPAMTGWENATTLSASYRHMWTGMPQSPKTATLSFQRPIEEQNMAYGAYFMHDQTGPTSFTGLNFLYSYQIRLKPELEGRATRNRLSMGLSLSALFYRLKGADLDPIDPGDELIIQNNEFQFLPDAGAGLFYYSDEHYIGFSVPQMISLRTRFDDDLAISRIRRIAHFYVTAGAKLEIKTQDVGASSKHKHYLIPSFWVKYAPVSPVNVNANLRYMYDDVFMAGLGFSTDGTILADFNVYFMEHYRIGYAFSIGINGLNPTLGTNHEVLFTYIFGSEGKGWYLPEVKGSF